MKKPKGIICFYHANCTDGAASAAVIKLKYPKAKLYPLNHGDLIKIGVNDKKVFVVDFSFDASILARMKQKAHSVFWYDHHITSIPIEKDLGWGVINLKESGASLTWKMEFPHRPMPKVIAYVKDKDLYTWKLPYSRAISMEMKNLDGILKPDSKTWKKLLKMNSRQEWNKLKDRGESALKYQRVNILNGIRNGFEVKFHGHNAYAVNYSQEASDVGEYIYKELGYAIAIVFYYTGSVWNFSLRSNRIDVSKLALKHGGGGHPGAAGFRTKSIDWLFRLKKEK
jgi:oligoribonuclease NrnB/cAMP/cGMP phosphodiesterase (DHH superfamily)